MIRAFGLGVLVALATLASASPAQAADLVATATAAAHGEAGEDRAGWDEGGGTRPVERVERIEVLGNTKTTAGVILRRVPFEPGDPLDDTLLEESRLRLLATNYFRTVEFSVRRGSQRGRVVLVVTVAERNTITIDALYIGFSRIVPFYAGIGLLESNFLGRGLSIGAGFVGGRERNAGRATYFAPDLFDTRLQFSASALLVHAAELLDPNNTSGPDLRYSRAGGGVGLGVRVGTAQRVSLDYRLESVTAHCPAIGDGQGCANSLSIHTGDSIVSTFALTYEWDTRDDAFVPGQGARVALAIEIGSRLLRSTYEYSKYTLGGELGYTVAGGHRLRLHAFGGIIEGTAPFFDQFFLADYAYFTPGRNALPRAFQVNYSASNTYDNLVISLGVDYNIPLQEGGEWFFRTYLYGGIAAAASGSLMELGDQVRGHGGQVPFSFDLGIRADTLIGTFTWSLSYVLSRAL